MSNKEYNEMIRLYLRLKNLIDKYNEYFECEDFKEEKDPIMIPADVYEDICDELGRIEIGLMGIS